MDAESIPAVKVTLPTVQFEPSVAVPPLLLTAKGDAVVTPPLLVTVWLLAPVRANVKLAPPNADAVAMDTLPCTANVYGEAGLFTTPEVLVKLPAKVQLDPSVRVAVEVKLPNGSAPQVSVDVPLNAMVPLLWLKVPPLLAKLPVTDIVPEGAVKMPDDSVKS